MAPWLFAAAYVAFERLQHIWADMASRGRQLRGWVTEPCGWHLEIVECPRRWGWYPSGVEPPPLPAFTVLPRRWVVERTIAWIGRYRRLSNEYEYLPESSEAMIYLAMCRLMLRRLARQTPDGTPSPQRQGLNGLARAFSTASTVMQRKCHAPRAPRRMKRGLGSAVPQEAGTMRPSWAGSEVVESVVP